MLTVLISMILVIIGILLILLGVVVVGIRQEPPWTELSDVAPSPVAVMVRRLLGLYVRRPTLTAVSTGPQDQRSLDTPATQTRAPIHPRG
jgi:hypothetical protein